MCATVLKATLYANHLRKDGRRCHAPTRAAARFRARFSFYLVRESRPTKEAHISLDGRAHCCCRSRRQVRGTGDAAAETLYGWPNSAVNGALQDPFDAAETRLQSA
jgi:hypothetical protein